MPRIPINAEDKQASAEPPEDDHEVPSAAAAAARRAAEAYQNAGATASAANDSPGGDDTMDKKNDLNDAPDVEIPPQAAAQPAPPAPPTDKADPARAAEYLDMLQRLKAEFENYKKRVTREKADTIKYGNGELLLKVLPIVDNLQRAVQASREGGMADDILKGVEMVEKQLVDLLADYGVEPFESLDQPFDPNRHEPMAVIERDDVEENTVIQELERGYMMHERVLRVARVMVSRAPQQQEPPPDGSD